MNSNHGGQQGGSNYIWLGDTTNLKISIEDGNNSLTAVFAVVLDRASGCVMGFCLDFAPPEEVLISALRHAVLPKRYPLDYELNFEWSTYGIPDYLVVDSFFANSQPLRQLAAKLGISEQTQQSELFQLSKLERFFQIVDRDIFLSSGHTRNAVRSDRAKTINRLSALELEKLLVGYIVNNYNQQLNPRFPNQTRLETWQSGLVIPPPRLQPQDLDL